MIVAAVLHDSLLVAVAAAAARCRGLWIIYQKSRQKNLKSFLLGWTNSD
jgi:hypothetical protein